MTENSAACSETEPLIGQTERPESTTKLGILCENCKTKPSSLWCENCDGGTYYCIECNISLHSGERASHHIRYALKDKPEILTLSKCRAHHKDSEFYCVKEKVFMCYLCLVDDHISHETMSVFKYADKLRVEMKDWVEPLKELLSPLEEIEKQLRKLEESDVEEVNKLSSRVSAINEEIAKHRAEIQRVKERQEKLKTSQVVFNAEIGQLSTMELLDQKKTENIKRRIQAAVLEEQKEKERLEQERIEQEKAEQERIEKDRIRQLPWAICTASNVSVHSKEYEVATTSLLKQNWADFTKLASGIGILTLDSYKPSPSLSTQIIHFRDSLSRYCCMRGRDYFTHRLQLERCNKGEARIVMKHYPNTKSLAECYPEPPLFPTRVVLDNDLVLLFRK